MQSPTPFDDHRRALREFAEWVRQPCAPVRLYHGTSAARWKNFLRDGIRPRGADAGAMGQKSDPRNVYLSLHLAPAYAALAAAPGEPLFLIEVDFDALDTSRFFPDDDFIAILDGESCEILGDDAREKLKRTYAAQSADEWTLLKARIHERAEFLKHLWQHSLVETGTVAHRGIVPPSAFTRIAMCPRSELLCACPLNGELDMKWAARATEWIFSGPAPEEARWIKAISH
jgi:hypothetical protein